LDIPRLTWVCATEKCFHRPFLAAILSIKPSSGFRSDVGLTFPNPPLEPASDHVNAEDRDGMSRQTADYRALTECFRPAGPQVYDSLEGIVTGLVLGEKRPWSYDVPPVGFTAAGQTGTCGAATVVRIEIPVDVAVKSPGRRGRLPAQHIGISGQREAADGRRADVQCRHGSRRTAAIGRITALFEMDLNRLRLPRVVWFFR